MSDNNSFETTGSVAKGSEENFYKLLCEGLKAENDALKVEHEIVVKNLIQVCVSLGLLPYKEGDNVIKKIMKEAKTIIGEMTFNQKAVGRRFAFLESEFFPLILKYQANGTVDRYLKK